MVRPKGKSRLVQKLNTKNERNGKLIEVMIDDPNNILPLVLLSREKGAPRPVVKFARRPLGFAEDRMLREMKADDPCNEACGGRKDENAHRSRVGEVIRRDHGQGASRGAASHYCTLSKSKAQLPPLPSHLLLDKIKCGERLNGNDEDKTDRQETRFQTGQRPQLMRSSTASR